MRFRGVLLLWLAAGCDRIFALEPHPPPDAPPPQGRWATLSAGDLHTCGIDLDGALFCWGDNAAGQLGRSPSDLTESTLPLAVPGTWRTVSAGGAHTCAIATDGALACWGDNLDGQSGTGTAAARVPPTVISPGPWRAVSAGLLVTCGITEVGAASCWGSNANGAVGDGAATSARSPSPIASQAAFASITAGNQHACALSTEGALWCWGYNGFGQVGDGTAGNKSTPTEIEPGTRWLAVEAGAHTTCAIRDDGVLFCWGQASSGEIGDGTTANARYLPQPAGLEDDRWTAIEVGAARACGTRVDGTLLCWGRNDQEQLPSPRALAIQSAPVEVPVKRGSWKAVTLGALHACLLDAHDNAWCVGNAGRGQLGNGGGSHTRPVQVPGQWLAVEAGDDITCALSDTARLECWGTNHLGQLGDGSRLARQRPVRAAVPTPITQFQVGGNHVIARRENELWGFGYNGYGQVGPVVTIDHDPVLIPSTSPGPAAPRPDGRDLAAGDHSCAITSTTELECWGRNDWAQLGRGGVTYTVEPVPTRISGSGYQAIAASSHHACAIATTGLYCWGLNLSGQLGDGTVSTRTSPAQISPTAPDAISAGAAHTCALSGTKLACWGDNTYGALGLGDTMTRYTPTVLEEPIEWATLARSFGQYNTCALDTRQRLYCWGRNHRGQLGIGSFIDQTRPTLVDDNTWLSVAMGVRHTCGIRTDHSLWCWGNAVRGAIGDGTAWTGDLVEVPSP